MTALNQHILYDFLSNFQEFDQSTLYETLNCQFVHSLYRIALDTQER